MQIIFLVVIALLIAYLAGRNRQIGFGYSLFFCIFLSPIIGAIITFASPSTSKPPPDKSNIKIYLGYAILLLSSIVVISGLFRIGSGPVPEAIYTIVGFYIGIIGAGLYLIKRGKGVIPNTDQHSVVQPKESKDLI
jgi:hypothetical protein